MPFVDFVCKNCGEKVDDIFFRKHGGPFRHKCPSCKKPMQQRIAPTAFTFEFKEGFDAGLGEYCDTRKNRERHIREKGLIKK